MRHSDGAYQRAKDIAGFGEVCNFTTIPMTTETLSCELESEACRNDKSSSTFEEVILDDRSVCDHCFKEVYEVTEEWYPNSLRNSAKDMLQNPRYDGREDNTEVVEDLHPYRSGETRSCNCGSVDFVSYNRPLKKGVFMEYAENLSQRLYERGEKHDEDRFLNLCRDLKGADELKDDMIYCEVTEEVTQ